MSVCCSSPPHPHTHTHTHTQCPSNRNNKGDFLAGAFFLRELWNPFQNMAQILKQVSQQTPPSGMVPTDLVPSQSENMCLTTFHLTLTPTSLSFHLTLTPTSPLPLPPSLPLWLVSVATNAGNDTLLYQRSISCPSTTGGAGTQLAHCHSHIHCSATRLGFLRHLQQHLRYLYCIHDDVADLRVLLVLDDPKNRRWFKQRQ